VSRERRTIFSTEPPPNDLAGRACATVQGLSMCTYRVIHRLHHNNLYGELDPDTALHSGYPRGKAYPEETCDLSGFTAWKTTRISSAERRRSTPDQCGPPPLDDTSGKLRVKREATGIW
jgi:hypothetical protein